MKNNKVNAAEMDIVPIESLANAVDSIMDFCNPTEDRGQWLAFALKEPRQMFIHNYLFTMFNGNADSDERWIREHTPRYLPGFIKRRWQRKKRTEIIIKHADWTSKFLTAAVAAMNVTAGLLGLPWQDPNKPLDVFIVVGDGDEDGRIDVSDLSHSEPVLHFVLQGGHIISVHEFKAGLEQLLSDIERDEKKAIENEKKRIETAKKNGNPLAGTEFEGLLS